MPVSAKTLGAVVGAALKEIGEPEITAFTSGNILQERLIEVANNAVRDIRDRFNPDWVYKRTTLQMTGDVTTENCAVTNGSTTATSVDSDGADAQNWTSDVSAYSATTPGSWLRMTADLHSYRITGVDSSSDPNTVTLEDAYRGTTDTAGGYRIFTDTYNITDSDFGQLQMASYGDAQAWTWGLTATAVQDRTVDIVSMPSLLERAGGDLHRNTSGRPRFIAEVEPLTGAVATFVVWPFPTDDWIINLWYSIEYTEISTFSTAMFANDAPPTACDAVEHAVVSAAHLWNEDMDKASVYEQKYQVAVANLVRRDNRERKDVGFDVATYRQKYGINYPTRSGIWFDTKPAQRARGW